MRTLRRINRVTLMALAAVALAASPAVVSASTASATSLTSVSIQATVVAGFSGVWTASGAISDSGSFARTDVHLTGSFFEAKAVVGAFQATFLFSGSQGTFTVMDELVGSAAGVNGNWQILAGTGAYGRISGHGTSTFDFSTSTVLFTGVISKAG